MAKKPSSNKKSKIESPDPDKVSYAENYLRQNMSYYPIESLKSALLAGGYSDAEIKQAVFNVNNPHASDSTISQGLPDIGSLFSVTWNFFKGNFLTLFAIQLIALSPGIMLQIKNTAVLSQLEKEIKDVSYYETLQNLREFLFNFLDPVNIILLILIIPMIILGTVALYRAIILKDIGEEVDILESYKNGL